METNEYFDQFTELYCDGFTEECIIASLIDSGHQDVLEFLPNEKDYVQRLITEGATYKDMIFKYWGKCTMKYGATFLIVSEIKLCSNGMFAL